MGDKVNATKADINTEPATTMANSLNNFPVIPPKKRMGRKTAASVTVVEITAKYISPEAFARGFQRRHSFLYLAVNIFQHHNGIIYHQANGQYQTQQG